MSEGTKSPLQQLDHIKKATEDLMARELDAQGYIRKLEDAICALHNFVFGLEGKQCGK